MAASQMAMCSSRQALEGGGAGLSACKSSCFCGGTRPPTSVPAWPRCDRHPHLVVRAQDAKRGTRIFKFNKKEEVPEASETAAGRGTRLFRFGAKKEEEEEEDASVETPKFGTQLFKSLGKKEAGRGGALVPTKQINLSFSLPRRQDPKAVFVTGATGQIGARIVQKLLRQGFSVRAGVRDLFVAQQLAELATQYGVVSREEAKRLNAVEFDFKDVESIAKAVGSAAKVVLTIGPTEDGPKSKVSFEDASNVVEAAKLANVANLVVVYEPGVGAGADENPLSGLTSFFSELFSKPVAVSLSELVNQIADSDVSYTLIKTTLTDGVDDVSPAPQNIELCKEGTPVLSENSKISKGQVASIVAEVLVNPVVAENKVVEAFTSSSAAAIPISNLFSAIPVDGRREAMAAARAEAAEEERERAAREKAAADTRAAVEEARKASQLAAQLEAEAKQLAAEEVKVASLAERAQAQAMAAAASVDSLAARIKDLPGPQLLQAKAAAAKVAVPSFSLPALPNLSIKSRAPTPGKPKKKPMREAAAPPSAAPASKPQVNSIFGGLFTQETVYIDEA